MTAKKALSALAVAASLWMSVVGIAHAQEKSITVSAAISLRNAFGEIGRLYESKHEGTKVFFNFGASGNLARQIIAGAPVDVFASAAQKDMSEVREKGLVAPGSWTDFAGNSVVLIVPGRSGNALKSIEGLASPGIGKIAIGNPKTVPAGRYAAEVLCYYALSAKVKNRLVFAENVRQVLDYVARNEVDAGIVYATDAAARSKEVRVVVSAPEESHTPVVYPIAVIRDSRAPDLSEEFVAIVTSEAGQEILGKYGFRSITGKE